MREKTINSSSQQDSQHQTCTEKWQMTIFHLSVLQFQRMQWLAFSHHSTAVRD